MIGDTQRKILIVDDDVFTREMYADVFRRAGYEVFEASDGVEGVDIATKNLPDVVFTGIVMPRMDGFTLIETLKKHSLTSKIPVFMSSHLGREEDRSRAEALGVKSFIIRDFTSPTEVVNLVSASFSENEEYTLDFDRFHFDAQRLCQDLNLPGDFHCPQCGDSLMLKIRVLEHGACSGHFACSHCNWKQM